MSSADMRLVAGVGHKETIVWWLTLEGNNKWSCSLPYMSRHKGPSTRWDFWAWDFCDTTSNICDKTWNICDTTWNICEQRQTKSHESLIVWMHFERRQIFVRFCSTMFHEDGAYSKMPNIHEILWNNVEQNLIMWTHTHSSNKFSWDFCSTLFHECFLTQVIKHRETTWNIIKYPWGDFSLCSMDVYLNSWGPLLSWQFILNHHAVLLISTKLARLCGDSRPHWVQTEKAEIPSRVSWNIKQNFTKISLCGQVINYIKLKRLFRWRMLWKPIC
jgi:hypothetical protein